MTSSPSYFERTWVGRRRGRGRPLYNIDRWNQRQRVLQDLMTTNNNVEGFHNGFASLVGYNNPTIWDWLNAVRAKQTLSANDIAWELEDLPATKSYPNILARRKELSRSLQYFHVNLYKFEIILIKHWFLLLSKRSNVLMSNIMHNNVLTVLQLSMWLSALVTSA